MKHLIAYSLYGHAPRYYVGAIKNAIIAKTYFSEYKLRFYVGESVPGWVKDTLKLVGNSEIVEMISAENNTAMFWRFYALADLDYDYILVRDADARLNLREKVAHEEFVASGKDFHIIKDHPTGHNYNISAGLFAAKKGAVHDIYKLVNAWGPKNTYGDDMAFLSALVYPRALSSVLVHDEYFNTPDSTKIKVPKRSTLDMIGAAVDENDIFVYDIDRKTSLAETGSERYANYPFIA